MDTGWIKLHRNLLRWEWYDDIPTKTVFLHLLLTVNYEPSKYRGHDIPAGSGVYGRKKLAEQTCLSPQQVRTALNKLEQTDEITIQSTNQFSIISMTSWDRYQHEQPTDNKRITNEQQTSNKRITTSKERNNIRNKNKEVEGAFDLWNEMASRSGLPAAQKVTASRKAKMSARLKDCGGIDGWRVALEKVTASDFLVGNNDRGWKADIDFVLRESSFVKLMEGKYDGSGKQQSGRSNIGEQAANLMEQYSDTGSN
jgi:hypothetical protein